MAIKHSTKNFEYEIVHQILFGELCFDICNSIEIIPGRGNDFLPYYYNLNFVKGIISLHSLLESGDSSELSIKNYIKQHEYDYPRVDLLDFKKKIQKIKSDFAKITPLRLRHKIGAHIDGEFTHTDFACSYIMPELTSQYLELSRALKNTFFEFSNYSKSDDPFYKIRIQSKSIVDSIIS